MNFPSKGLPKTEIEDSLRKFEKQSKIDPPGIERQLNGSFDLTELTDVKEVVKLALLRFIEAQVPLHSQEGIGEMEDEVVSMLGTLWGAENPAGFMTSGGTESNFLALYVALKRANRRGSVILPQTAHASLFKACDYLGLQPIRVPVKSDFTADATRMRDSVRQDTIAIIATCGVFPWATIDPIEEIGKVAEEKSLYFHVDAAYGGLLCPWLREIGYDIPEFGFKVKGVSSVSSDPQKRGFSLHPAGAIIFRDESLAKLATYYNSDPWQSYKMYRGLLGSRPGYTVAITWALFNYLGREGYIRLSKKCMDLVQGFTDGVKGIPGLTSASEPKVNIANVVSDSLDMNLIKQGLRGRGWRFYDIEAAPMSRENALAVVLVPYHERVLPVFLKALEAAADEAKRKDPHA